MEYYINFNFHANKTFDEHSNKCFVFEGNIEIYTETKAND